MMRIPSLLPLLFLAASACLAADGDPGAAAALLDPASFRRPRAGEWLEYRLAYPVDPLENSLSPEPIPPPPSAGGGDDAFVPPRFEAPEAWRVLPLRIEVLKVENDRLRVRMTFAGTSREVDLDLSADRQRSEFHYDPPQPATIVGVHEIDGEEYSVQTIRRRDGRHGFARMTSREAPFGLIRFATANIDLVLVGLGQGHPPDFPLPLRGGVHPPPGLFYGGD